MISSISPRRADLLSSAQAFKTEFEGDKTFPYPAHVKAENDFFISYLKNNTQGADLAALKAESAATAKSASRKAWITTGLSVAALGASFALPAFAHVSLGMAGNLLQLGGFMGVFFIEPKQRAQAQQAQLFGTMLDNWDSALTASAASTPPPAPQPTPAPAPPAPAEQPKA